MTDKLDRNMETLAKWAAHQPDAAEAGGLVVYMLGKGAEIRRDGTPAQIERARQEIERFRAKPGDLSVESLRGFVAKLDEISGHEGIRL
jgi:hypothetical protein